MPLPYLIRIAQTPAPTFQEGQRAALILSLWRELGHDPVLDTAGNVVLRLGPPATPECAALLLTAHLDSVFDLNTNVSVHEIGGRLVGAGVGDNAASLAVLTAFLRQVPPETLTRPLWIAANVAEEGLGDLRGAKTLLSEHHALLSGFVAVDGYLGAAVTQAVGVRRYRMSFHGEGGHSWGVSGPSALHALGVAVSGLYALALPTTPRTTLNVGVASGGNSVNSIAAQAELLLDLRSLDGAILQRVAQQAQQTAQAAARQVGVSVRIEQVGDRPGGDLRSAPLLNLARQAAMPLGLDIRTAQSSTDANAAAPYNLSALALGVYRGGNAHRLDEWVQPQSLGVGLRLLLGFVAAYMAQ